MIDFVSELIMTLWEFHLWEPQSTSSQVVFIFTVCMYHHMFPGQMMTNVREAKPVCNRSFGTSIMDEWHLYWSKAKFSFHGYRSNTNGMKGTRGEDCFKYKNWNEFELISRCMRWLRTKWALTSTQLRAFESRIPFIKKYNGAPCLVKDSDTGFVFCKKPSYLVFSYWNSLSLLMG